MRIISRPLAFLYFLLVCLASVNAQEVPGSTAPAAIPRDPQAVSVLTQALSAARGSSSSISAIQDYTAVGTITVMAPSGQLQGSVTITALGPSEFRMDMSVPAGTRSVAVHNGILSTKTEDGTVTSLDPRIWFPNFPRVSHFR